MQTGAGFFLRSPLSLWTKISVEGVRVKNILFYGGSEADFNKAAEIKEYLKARCLIGAENPGLALRVGQQYRMESYCFSLSCKSDVEYYLPQFDLIVVLPSIQTKDIAVLVKKCSSVQLPMIVLNSKMWELSSLINGAQSFHSIAFGCDLQTLLIDLVVARLKKNLPAATRLDVALSGNFFESANGIYTGMQWRSHIENGSNKMRGGVSPNCTNRFPLRATQTDLCVEIPHISSFFAWMSCKIPHVHIYKETTENELRLLRWIYRLRFVLPRKLEKRLFEHFKLKQNSENSFFLWAKVTNKKGEHSFLRLTIPEKLGMDHGQPWWRQLEQKMWMKLVENTKKGFVTPSMMLGFDDILNLTEMQVEEYKY